MPDTARFVLTGSIVNNAYDSEQDIIELLYKDGRIRDIAEASDNLGIQAPAQPVESTTWPFPAGWSPRTSGCRRTRPPCHEHPARIALVTGATSGFGWATARRPAAEGWRVILTGRRRDRLDALQQELEGLHGKLEGHSAVYPCASTCATGPMWSVPSPPAGGMAAIDLLVNNAGLAAGMDPVQQGDPTTGNACWTPT